MDLISGVIFGVISHDELDQNQTQINRAMMRFVLQETDPLREVEEEENMMRSQHDDGGIGEHEERRGRRWGGGTEAAAAVSEAPAFYPVTMAPARQSEKAPPSTIFLP